MISFWARNFLNKDYAAFYFETMNKGFMQQGRPMQFGIESSLPILRAYKSGDPALTIIYFE